MRYAIKTAPQHTTWTDMLDVWREADRIELFESAWNFDHFYPINTDDSSGPCLEAWVTLAALAQATQRIRIGTMVNGVIYRHPAVLANMAASLDIISGGRLELGLGAGWNLAECDAYGIELGSLTERFDRFDEAVAVIISLLANETTDHDGEHYRLRAARCEPKPVQQPHPPICIGGRGPRRTLPLVARRAQHWNFPGRDADDLIATRGLLEEQCHLIGRDPSDITVSQHIFVDPEPDLAAITHQADQLEAAGLDLAIIYLPTPHRAADVERIATALDNR